MSYIVRWEAGFPFDHVSPQVEDLLGFPAERLVAEPDLWAERLHPEDRERVLEEERRSLEHGRDSSDCEYRMIAADGCVVWVWERDRIARDNAGRPVTSEGLLIDITERKHAEARAQHYLDVAGTILLVLRTDQTVDLLNRHGRELLGYGEGDLLGRNWYDVVLPRRTAPRGGPTSSAPCAATRSRSPTTRATSSPGPASGARSPGATPSCATSAATCSACSPPARTSPSGCARRTRSPVSPTSSRSPASPTGRSSRRSCGAA